MDRLHWVLIAIIAIIAFGVGFLSYASASANPWGVTRYGAKCWHEDSMPSNIALKIRFPNEQSCKAFLDKQNGE